MPSTHTSAPRRRGWNGVLPQSVSLTQIQPSGHINSKLRHRFPIQNPCTASKNRNRAATAIMSRVAVLKGTAKIAQHGPGLIREILYGTVLGIGGKSLNMHSLLVSIIFRERPTERKFHA